MEPAMRFELMTSSLPRRRSTPELRGRDVRQIVNLPVRLFTISIRTSQQLVLHELWSGRRDSNSRPSAWKADALPTELHPLTLRDFKYPHRNLKCHLVQGVGFEP